MNDENHWYGEGWRTLRRQVLNLAMAQSADLLDALDAGEPKNTIRERIENFAARVQQAIAARIDARRVGLWNFALQIWPEAAVLQAAFLNDLPALRGAKPDVLPEQALRAHKRNCR